LGNGAAYAANESGLMLVYMYIALWKRNTDSFGIKSFFDRFSGIEKNTPVIRY
jgi:hypothetical protein